MPDAAKVGQPVAGASAGTGVRHTRWFLVTYYLLATVWGARSVRPDVPSGLDLLVPAALAAALGWWAVVDARRRQHPIPLLARPWLFLLAGLAVPVYVVWSRGYRGVGLVGLHAVLWFALATASLHAVGVAVYGEQWLRGIGL